MIIKKLDSEKIPVTARLTRMTWTEFQTFYRRVEKAVTESKDGEMVVLSPAASDVWLIDPEKKEAELRARAVLATVRESHPHDQTVES